MTRSGNRSAQVVQMAAVRAARSRSAFPPPSHPVQDDAPGDQVEPMGREEAQVSSPAGEARRERIRRLPEGRVKIWSMAFHGLGSEYARLWFASLLWTVLTFGAFLPWAWARHQRYLMRHTRVAGHRLDDWESGVHRLPRYALAVCLLAGVAGAWAGSPWAGATALSLAVAVCPLLVYMGLTQRAVHTSWAGRRLLFSASCGDVYRALWMPLAALIALPWLGLWAASMPLRERGVVMGLAVPGVVLLMLPAALWQWLSFRQEHLHVGPFQLAWKAARADVMAMLTRLLVWGAMSAIMGVGLAVLLFAALDALAPQAATRPKLLGACVPAVFVWWCLLWPYAQACWQNLVWNHTGNRYLRVRSKLSVPGHVGLHCRHALLLLITLGMYWPWAVIETRRSRTHAVSIWSRVDTDTLKAHWQAHPAPDGSASAKG